MKVIPSLLLSLLVCICSRNSTAQQPDIANQSAADLSKWKLVWQDDFDYPDDQLDTNWIAQNGPSGHILCSRWRENVVISNGILQLINRKEDRGGQEWTSGNIWTKKKFKYGFFECRYRYAEATGTNNSFWLMTQGPEPTDGKRFEIDINEGHYPNEVNTNIHNWSDVVTNADGKKTHPSNHLGIAFGNRPDYTIPFEIPVTTTKLRLTSTSAPHFHIREFRIFPANGSDYPDAFSPTADRDIPGLVNYARSPDVQITANGVYNNQTKPRHAADGKITTSWISPADGEKWLQFEWPSPITIGCIQFINGWSDKGKWTGLGQLNNYKIQAYIDDHWQNISSMDSKDIANFAADYHTYGLQWDENELVFYHDGKEIRREQNTFCFSETPIWLSLAIIRWAGPLTDDLDGSSMKVDWVRYFQQSK